MNNEFIFVRHAESIVDDRKAPSDWVLSPAGKRQSLELATSIEFQDLNVIVTSNEQKAIDTASPLSEKLGLKIIQNSAFNELTRAHVPNQTIEQYRTKVEQVFSQSEKPIPGWESSQDALDRISDGVMALEVQYDSQKIMIVSHGMILSLYFAWLQNEMANLYERWVNLGFCSWSIVQNGKVLKIHQ
ncbi:MAG: histidine phosphatase family protein [Candidatus Thorarchaeota archaeon]|jgi:broad specificity phosphatase PhoE